MSEARMNLPLSRRAVLVASGGAAIAAAALGPRAITQLRGTKAPEVQKAEGPKDWDWVRNLFALSNGKVHMSTMLISSHPQPVRDAIEKHRRAMDADPVEYLEKNNDPLTELVLHAASDYLGIDPSHVALTDSTTMGVGLVYGGLKLRSGDDILTTEQDYYVTHESLRLLAQKTGAGLRKISLFETADKTSEDEIVAGITKAILPSTRLIALTWVHSSTGLKIPVSSIAAAIGEINKSREERDHILLGLDGVHGFGVEDISFPELGCDFLMAGCHKWLFGPRGTGIVAFSEKGLTAVRPSIPSFNDSAVFNAWLEQRHEPPGINNGSRMTPGGFKAFEHRWALTQAFELHQQLAKNRVASRTHELALALKEALTEISGVVVRTPRDSTLSAGIVSFDVEGSSPKQVVSLLRQQNIIASVAPYATPHVRLTPSIRNSELEVQEVANAMRRVA